jgi:chorismate mutase/prephenate dehydratase
MEDFMNLEELRQEIDKVDDKIINDIKERMEVSAKIAEYKKENGLPVTDARREREKINEISEKSDPEIKAYMRVLYSLIFELSRSYQNKVMSTKASLFKDISSAIENTDKLFPVSPRVACQGVEGAYSSQACDKLFKAPSIMYMKSFDGVFSAVESGLCSYGVIPLENSTAGSVKKVYDLMIEHNFKIVRSLRLKVDHSLIAKNGVKLSDIKEIVSHEQAINQCSDFLSNLKDIKITYCENTALAAKMVAESDRKDIAALSSHNCAELYGLNCIESSVQDNQNNYTRFICISKNLEIYPGADKTQIMMVLPHKPGSLYKTLSRFYALDINLLKLESRPIPDKNFEFMFYFELETSVYSDEFVRLICEIDEICEDFKYLGSYSEVI